MLWFVAIVGVLVLVPPARQFVWDNATLIAIVALIAIAGRAALDRTGHTVGSLMGQPPRNRRCGVCRGFGKSKYGYETGWNPKASVPTYSYKKETCRSCGGSGTVRY